MITRKNEDAYKKFCPLSVAEEIRCCGESCMAWRTVDGDLDHGFCGMVPVLPYILRGDTVQRSVGTGQVMQIVGSGNRVGGNW